MKKIILIAIGYMFLYTQAGAQMEKRSSLMHLSWEIAFPVSNPYLSETSLSGGRFEFRQMIKPNTSVGLAMSWNSFDEYVGRKTYTSGDGATAVTTDMVRQIYTLPITAVIHRYFYGKSKKLVPNIGIGLGAMYAEQSSFINIYEISSENWGFVVRPEAGLMYEMGSGFYGQLGASYQWASNKNEGLKLNSLSQFAINVGIAWKIY
jgi:outer membrane protein W